MNAAVKSVVRELAERGGSFVEMCLKYSLQIREFGRVDVHCNRDIIKRIMQQFDKS